MYFNTIQNKWNEVIRTEPETHLNILIYDKSEIMVVAEII